MDYANDMTMYKILLGVKQKLANAKSKRQSEMKGLWYMTSVE